MAGAGRYVSVMVRPLLEGCCLSDPETAPCQTDALGIVDEAASRTAWRERACRETCVAQQGA